MARYIAIQEGEDWRVRDTEDQVTLLGYYTEGAAHRTAKRLNANIPLSPNEQRAFNTLLSTGTLTAHQLYEQFKGKPLGHDGTEGGLRIAEVWRGHGLVRIVGNDVIATDWAFEWAARRRPE